MIVSFVILECVFFPEKVIQAYLVKEVLQDFQGLLENLVVMVEQVKNS